ncbi:MAG: glycoside hydrolase family 88 protein [Sediminibacterium sp.]|nr:glycoside hydrolase family 88 protein [Sediminibacterium sp.]
MKILFISALVCIGYCSKAQVKGNDVTTPLHLLQPEYKVPYGAPSVDNVKKVLKKVFNYLDAVTPAQFIDKRTQSVITDLSKIDTNTVFKTADFRLTSYEWGVTYAGMLSAGEATGDTAYTHYTKERLHFLADAWPAFTKLYQQYPKNSNPLRQPVAPHALDDGGAVCAAMIKTLRVNGHSNLRPLIDHLVDYIANKEFRFKDGTLARNRPQKNTLWLDDMFMGIPALAQMGKLTGDQKYFNDAVKQVLQYSERMFNKNLGVYMHGWVEEMTVHPEFHWARANGWAMMAMTELLDVLPETHPKRKQVIEQLQAQIKGIASYQSGEGFWHQLVDRTDSYMETSATAIYAYCIARAINKGWIDAKAYSPVCMLAWNAVATKVNDKGQVEGTCVGTGMAFDPAFYYYRPVNIYAAHGYGPVLLAGAEILNLLHNFSFEINDSSLQLKSKN